MAYTAKYITTAMITDSIARDFISGTDTRLDTWMENTDLEIESIAQEKGVLAANIKITPLHYKIKEYAIAYYCFLVFQDAFGENDVAVSENEVHHMKLKYYLDKCNFLRPILTKDMFWQESANLASEQRVSGGVIWM